MTLSFECYVLSLDPHALQPSIWDSLLSKVWLLQRVSSGRLPFTKQGHGFPLLLLIPWTICVVAKGKNEIVSALQASVYQYQCLKVSSPIPEDKMMKLNLTVSQSFPPGGCVIKSQLCAKNALCRCSHIKDAKVRLGLGSVPKLNEFAVYWTHLKWNRAW